MMHPSRTSPTDGNPWAWLSVGLLACGLIVPVALKGQEAPSHDPAALARAEELVKDVFKDEYARAKTDVAVRKELAATLLKQADQIRDEAVVRFVALREARDLAAQAGDLATAFQAAEELVRDRPGNLLDMKIAVLETANLANTPAVHQSVAEAAFALALAAGDAEDYDQAVRLGQLAEEAARKAQASALLDTIGKRTGQLRTLQQETARVRPFLAKLKLRPEDAEANLELGKYWLFVRGDWDRGLPFLARGSQDGLRQLAGQDLTRPRQAQAQVELADGWWDAAQKEKDAARAQLLRRSYQWYQQAVHRLQGEPRRHAERRLTALRELLPAELRAADIAREIRRLEGHTGPVLGVALAPDGRLILSASADGTVRLWDVAGQELRQLKGHTAPVYSVAFAPDGRLAVSGGEDHTARLWEVETGKEIRRCEGHTDVVTSVAFAPDGRHFVSAGQDHTVRLWEVDSGKEVRRFVGHTDAVWAVAFSPDGSRLASGGTDQSVRLWESSSGKELRRLQGHTDQVLSVAFSPDGGQLLSTGVDHSIRLWEVDSGKELRGFEGHTATVSAVTFAADGLRFLSCGDDRTLRLWDVATGKQLRELQGHTDAVTQVVFARDGRLAVSCSLDRTVRLWGGPK